MLDDMVIKQGNPRAGGPTGAVSLERRRLVRRLVDRAGATYAAQAGVRLVDKPAALYQLLVLAQLMSTRISSDVAVAAARELWAVRLTTAARVRDAGHQDVVAALGRARYRRYDQITATRLIAAAGLVVDWYGGDLRRLGHEAEHDVRHAARLLEEFPGIGPVGARIFLREAQHVWPWLRPYADERVLDSANDLGLPHDVDELVSLAGRKDLSSLSAALVHVSLDRRLRAVVVDEEVLDAKVLDS